MPNLRARRLRGAADLLVCNTFLKSHLRSSALAWTNVVGVPSVVILAIDKGTANPILDYRIIDIFWQRVLLGTSAHRLHA